MENLAPREEDDPSMAKGGVQVQSTQSGRLAMKFSHQAHFSKEGAKLSCLGDENGQLILGILSFNLRFQTFSLEVSGEHVGEIRAGSNQLMRYSSDVKFVSKFFNSKMSRF